MVVSRDNPLSATRWPALTHQRNDLAGYVIFMNENKAGWLSKVFGEGEQTLCLIPSFIPIQSIVPSFYGVWCFAVTPKSTQPVMMIGLRNVNKS